MPYLANLEKSLKQSAPVEEVLLLFLLQVMRLKLTEKEVQRVHGVWREEHYLQYWHTIKLHHLILLSHSNLLVVSLVREGPVSQTY